MTEVKVMCLLKYIYVIMIQHIDKWQTSCGYLGNNLVWFDIFDKSQSIRCDRI